MTVEKSGNIQVSVVNGASYATLRLRLLKAI